MAKDDDKVSLPELPVFKKYSLALRQEFASPKEVLSVLERTASKVHAMLERAEAKRRRELESQQLEPEPELLPEPSSAEEMTDEGAELSSDAAPDEPFDLENYVSRASEVAEIELDEPPIWEPETEPAVSSPPPTGRPKRKKKAAARKRRPRPEIIPVSSRGTPLRRSRSPSRSRKKK